MRKNGMRRKIAPRRTVLSLLCAAFLLIALLPRCSEAAAYSLSFVVQPSDVMTGSFVFATIALKHPNSNLVGSNSVQFAICDAGGRPVPGTSVQPVTTDSLGLAIFKETVATPGKNYVLIASCRDAVLRSRPFDVLPGPDQLERSDPGASDAPVETPEEPVPSMPEKEKTKEPLWEAPVVRQSVPANPPAVVLPPRDPLSQDVPVVIPNPSLQKTPESYPY